MKSIIAIDPGKSGGIAKRYKRRAHRPILIQSNAAYVLLTQGQYAVIDRGDVSKIADYPWHTRKTKHTNYAKTTMHQNKYVLGIQMHRLILGIRDPKIDVDHIDGNGLNNTRANLRACTRQQNGLNKRKRTVGTSKFKGVNWHKKNKMWVARIHKNGKKTHIGSFALEAEAAKAYDEAAKTIHGDFACLNFSK